MAGSARIKVKKTMSETMASLGDMNAMFKGDPKTCFDNFIIINDNVKSIFTVFRMCKDVLLKESEIERAYQDYLAVLPNNIPNLTSLITGDIPPNFVDEYKQFKASRPVLNFIKTFTSMEVRKEYIIKENIMADIQGVSYVPFEEFPSFDLANAKEESYKLINIMMSMLYAPYKDLYENGIRKRDIDTEIITKALLAGIDEIKKTLPRHGKTFSFIQKHSEILKETINEHYIDYESSEGNSTVILSAYFKKLKDMSGDDINIRAGLRDIVAEIRKRVASNSQYFNNPQIKMALQILDDFNL